MSSTRDARCSAPTSNLTPKSNANLSPNPSPNPDATRSPPLTLPLTLTIALTLALTLALTPALTRFEVDLSTRTPSEILNEFCHNVRL